MNPRLYRLALLTSLASFLLVIAGGLVTSTDSGLAVPDWPLSYGTLFPPMVGGIRFEHTHRMIAATVGLLTLTLTLWILLAERRRWVRRLSLAVLGTVILQGLLGGVTVLWQLPLPISVAHACLGQIFFAMMVVLAMALGVRHPVNFYKDSAVSDTIRRLALLSTAAIFMQLILGAILRHAGWRPHLLAGHFFWALVVSVLIMKSAGGVLRQFRDEPALAQPARILIWLFLLQIGLGFLTVIRGREVFVATAHVAVGALLLAVSTVLTIRLFKMVPGTKTTKLFKSFAKKVPGTYWELTKPRLTMLAAATALIGFWLASPLRLDFWKLLLLLLGTELVGSGANTLNQYLEKEADAKMRRTSGRPLPSGRMNPASALGFGVWLSVAGLWILTLGVNPLAGSLAALTLATYLFLYTPLKRRTPLCTLIGAIPGAIPPLIGWAAAKGSLGLEAWWLFAILFLWQLPHFLAIAWECQEDYAKAGFKMLPILDPDGRMTGRQIVLYCLALVPVSLLSTPLGFTGTFYFLGALVSGLAFLSCGLWTAWARSRQSARRLFLASVCYLPWLMATLTLDRVVG